MFFPARRAAPNPLPFGRKERLPITERNLVMIRPLHFILTLGLAILAAWTEPGLGQETDYIARTQSRWGSRVVRTRSAPHDMAASTAPGPRASLPAGARVISDRPVSTGARYLQASQESAPPETIPPGEPLEGPEFDDATAVQYEEMAPPWTGSEAYYGPPYWYPGYFLFQGAWIEGLSLHAGVHGFKGPIDLGRNGNFGFHEGLNYGAPIGGPWGIGYQVGAQFTQSDFAGNQVLTQFDPGAITEQDRNQLFLTAGIFRRPDCGRWQWAVVVDWLHEDFYEDGDLLQLRHEISFFLDDCREIGYMGMYGLKDTEMTMPGGEIPTVLDLSILDRFAFFYRRQFEEGGEGRIWAGWSGYGDGLIGADAVVPLGQSWALETNFAYLAPKTGSGLDGQIDESWSLNIGLVWYPRRPVPFALSDPYRPVLGVGDNTSVMLRGRTR